MEWIPAISPKILGHVFTGSGYVLLGLKDYVQLSLCGALLFALIYFFFYRFGEKVFGGKEGLHSIRSLFCLTFVFYLLVALWAAVLYPPVADEPHYLLIAHSLVYDHDIDLANNYAQKDYLNFYPVDYLDMHGLFDQAGHFYSKHAPGLPLLIAPAYWLGGRFGVLIFMCFLGSLLITYTYLFCLESGCSPVTARTTCLFMAFSSPLMIHATLIYTEIPAALLLLYLVRRAVLASPIKPSQAALFGVLLSLFLWLHIKYVLLLLVLAGLIWLNLKGQLRQRRLFLTALVLAGLCFVIFYVFHYGLGRGVHGDDWQQDIPSVSSFNPLRGGLGILLDRDFGLLTYAPFYILAFVGWLLLQKEKAAPKMFFTVSLLGGCFFVFLSFFNPGCWSGSAAPARQILPVIPLLAPFLVRAGEEKNLRPLWKGLGFLSVAICYLLNVFPLLRYDMSRERLLGIIGALLHFDPLFFLPGLYQGAVGSVFLGGFYFCAVILLSYLYVRLKKVRFN